VATLAYIFWHRPRPDADPLAYERDLRSFHSDLRGTARSRLSRAGDDEPGAIEGFLGSRTLPVPRLDWLEGGGYEDWYLIDGFAALGPLAAGAVDAARAQSHDALARAVLEGAGGVYGLLAGTAFAPAGWVGWFLKRDGVSYEALSAHLRQRVAEGVVAAVWQRQLVLGPAPEFRVEATGVDPIEVEGADLAAAVPLGTPITG
jgi:hypothetical protein